MTDTSTPIHQVSRRFGILTYCSLDVINRILEEFERGQRYLPPSFVENLRRDKKDMERSEA